MIRHYIIKNKQKTATTTKKKNQACQHPSEFIKKNQVTLSVLGLIS